MAKTLSQDLPPSIRFDDPIDRTSRLLQTLVDFQVNVVIINLAPMFSDHPEPVFLDSIHHRYPEELVVGHFEVRWRE